MSLLYVMVLLGSPWISTSQMFSHYATGKASSWLCQPLHPWNWRKSRTTWEFSHSGWTCWL